MRARDVADLATLLLQALTQQRTYTLKSSGSSLPVPFGEVVANGIRGVWGLGQMAAALEATAPQTARVAPRPQPS